MRRALVIVVLVLPLLVAEAQAAAPAPMGVSGVARINGQPAPGAKVEVFAGGRLLVQTVANGTGGYGLTVPGDDPSTNAVEGARTGEPLRVAVQGAPVDGLVFAAGTSVAFDPDAGLPRLVPALQALPPTVGEGERLTLVFDVQNRGNATAQTPIVTLTDGAAQVASAVGSDIAPGATRAITVTLNTTGLAGNRTLVAAALARNGDVAPGGGRLSFPITIAAQGAPRVSVTIAPPQPRGGDTILLTVNATDDDGIAFVEVRWSVDNQTRAANLTRAPYAMTLGPFASNSTVEIVVSATDASHKTSALARTLQVGEGAAASVTPSATPGANGSPAPAVWGVWLVLVLVVGALAIAIYLGRRRSRS